MQLVILPLRGGFGRGGCINADGLFVELSCIERAFRVVGLQRCVGRMRPADFFRECAVDVAGAYPFFSHDDLGDGGIEPSAVSL